MRSDLFGFYRFEMASVKDGQGEIRRMNSSRKDCAIHSVDDVQAIPHSIKRENRYNDDGEHHSTHHHAGHAAMSL